MPDKNSQSNSQHSSQNVRRGINLQTRHKLALSFSLISILVTTTFWLLFQNGLDRSLQQYSDTFGASLAQQTAGAVRELVLVNDPLALNVALTQLVRDENVIYASIYDVDGNLLSRAGLESSIASNNGLVYTTDITVDDSIAGSVQLILDSETLTTSQSRLRNLFLAILALALVLTVAAAFAIAGGLTAPLVRIANRLEEKSQTDSEIQSAESKNEIVRLEQVSESIVQHIEEMENQMLETGVWESSNNDSDQEPGKVTASILIIKVVNINTAIELLHPATLNNLLTEYSFYLNQAARLYGGEIHRINGESVLVCFTSNICQEKHSINALYCAGLFQTLMSKINLQHKDKGQQILEFRMSIHSGDVFLAPEISATGSNCVLGKTIDIAYFLSKQGAPNELVISESACSQAREFEKFETSGQHEISMPADNVSFMAYILDNKFSGTMDNIQSQCSHILGEVSHLRIISNTNN